MKAYAKASWKLFNVASTSASAPPRYSSTSVCDHKSNTKRCTNAENLTMKGAFGIPRGFFSSENTALILGGISKGESSDPALEL